MRVLPLMVVFLALMACDTQLNAVPTSYDKATVERFVSGAITDRFPDYAFADEAASCVLENASEQEILLVAGQSGSSSTRARRAQAVVIALRPETQACFAAKNLPMLA